MKKIAILSAAALIAAAPSYAGTLAGVAEESDPFVQEEEDRGISPLIIIAGGLLAVGAIVALADSSSTVGTTANNNN